MAADTLVLWDLDLTLLDPAGFGTRMFVPALREVLGREAEVGFRFAGMTDRAICTRLLAENGADPEGEPELVDRLVEAFVAACHRESEDLVRGGGGPLPGAHDVVAALAGRPDVVQGVATGNARGTALLKLRVCGFSTWLDGSVGGYGDVHLDRRHLVADAIASAVGSSGPALGPDTRVVVVGDTVHDIRGALDAASSGSIAAGPGTPGHAPITAIGVASGYTDADTLRAAGAEHVLPDLTDTSAVLDALLPPAAADTPHR